MQPWSVLWLTGLLATSQVQDDPNSPARNLSGKDCNKVMSTLSDPLGTSQVQVVSNTPVRNVSGRDGNKVIPSDPLATSQVQDDPNSTARNASCKDCNKVIPIPSGPLSTSQVQNDPNSPVRNVSGRDGNKVIPTPSQVQDDLDPFWSLWLGDGNKAPPTTSEPEDQDNIDSLLKEIFSETGNETEAHERTTGTCFCVPYYLCNDAVVTNEFGIIDIRKTEIECSHYLDVCCDEANIVNDPIISTRPSSQTGSDAKVDILSTGPVAGGGTSQYLSRGCGYRNPEGVGFKIIGEKDGESQYAEFPWMVAVLRKERIDGRFLKVYKCGGALIHPKLVLTAAHCISETRIAKDLMVRVGEWDTQTRDEIFPHQDRDVIQIIVHPDFHAGPLFNDIALLELESPVDLQENVDIICLPPKDFVPDQKECLASGWGRDVFGKEGTYQVILKKRELQVVQHSKCQESLRKMRLEVHFELHKSFICARGISKKDMCNGDGGSPLVCPISGQPGRYYQAGIVAWGIGCGENDIPGIYANVAHLRPWIDEQMNNLMLDNKFYVY